MNVASIVGRATQNAIASLVTSLKMAGYGTAAHDTLARVPRDFPPTTVRRPPADKGPGRRVPFRASRPHPQARLLRLARRA